MISVIIPVYNGEKTLGALLESLARNTHREKEILVVDDGSIDRTGEIASRYPVKLLSTGGRRGPAAARNIGAKQAAGDVLLFLDADTSARPDLVGHIARRFEKEQELVAVVGYYDKVPLNRTAFARYKALMVHYWFRDAKVMESFETCCGAIRKEAFFRAGGFDESYADADVEDYEFGYRVMKEGPILVDHTMVVGHNFPSFSKNFRNYYRRSKLWMALFLSRRRFESTATTPGEGISRVAGVAAVVFLALGLFWNVLLYPALLVFGVYLALLRRFLALLRKEENGLFMLWGIGVHMASSVAVAGGIAAALCDRALPAGK
ncbi:MAG: glycosyltransferase [Chitinispirillaceae bacterium]|nr:glycosyltransferase [Chitinispirillaceae bacterium]